jgi:hypothetical protein
MTRFRIDYRVPNSDPEEYGVEFVEFDDWTGRATDHKGNEIGPVQTITAREWAEDAGYTLADKGPFTVTELKPCRTSITT